MLYLFLSLWFNKLLKYLACTTKMSSSLECNFAAGYNSLCQSNECKPVASIFALNISEKQ